MTDNEIFILLKNKFGAAKRSNNNWVRIKCPTCTPKDAAKLKRGVHLKTLVTNCFICQKPLSLEQLFGGVKIIPNAAGVEEVAEHPQARKWPCKAVIPICALEQDHPAVQFLAKDHLHDRYDYWTQYGVGYITTEDSIDIMFEKFDGPPSRINTAHSIVFPVYHNKEFVGWQLRFIPGTPHGDRMGKMKYLHVFQKGKYLYNYDNAKEFNSVVVVEGVKKAWKGPNCVATFGKGITQHQVQMIQQWEEIILMYDAGDKTQLQARQLCEDIKLNGKKCINIDPGKFGFDSPDEMSKDDFAMIVYEQWNKIYGRT